jgi:hypothetical protein
LLYSNEASPTITKTIRIVGGKMIDSPIRPIANKKQPIYLYKETSTQGGYNEFPKLLFWLYTPLCGAFFIKCVNIPPLAVKPHHVACVA